MVQKFVYGSSSCMATTSYILLIQWCWLKRTHLKALASNSAVLGPERSTVSPEVSYSLIFLFLWLSTLPLLLAARCRGTSLAKPNNSQSVCFRPPLEAQQHSCNMPACLFHARHCCHVQTPCRVRIGSKKYWEIRMNHIPAINNLNTYLGLPSTWTNKTICIWNHNLINIFDF